MGTVATRDIPRLPPTYPSVRRVAAPELSYQETSRRQDPGENQRSGEFRETVLSKRLAAGSARARHHAPRHMRSDTECAEPVVQRGLDYLPTRVRGQYFYRPLFLHALGAPSTVRIRRTDHWVIVPAADRPCLGEMPRAAPTPLAPAGARPTVPAPAFPFGQVLAEIRMWRAVGDGIHWPPQCASQD